MQLVTFLTHLPPVHPHGCPIEHQPAICVNAQPLDACSHRLLDRQYDRLRKKKKINLHQLDGLPVSLPHCWSAFPGPSDSDSWNFGCPTRCRYPPEPSGFRCQDRLRQCTPRPRHPSSSPLVPQCFGEVPAASL